MRTVSDRSKLESARLAAVRISGCLLLLMFCVPAVAIPPLPLPHRPQPREIVHIIRRLEWRWRQAELDANTAVMANMLAEDYLGISSDGTLATKAQTIDGFKSGAIRFTKIDTSEQHIRVYGTTAVVISKAEVTGVADGETIDGLYRYTRVYHRIHHVWKIVSFEASELREHGHSHRQATHFQQPGS